MTWICGERYMVIRKEKKYGGKRNIFLVPGKCVFVCIICKIIVGNLSHLVKWKNAKIGPLRYPTCHLV